MQDLRLTTGYALAASLLLVLIAGFVVTSTREMYLILAGYVFGVLGIYVLERCKASRSR